MTSPEQRRPIQPETWLRVPTHPWLCAAVDGRGAKCLRIAQHGPDEHDFQFPKPTGDHSWMGELNETQRVNLPSVYHRPHFLGICTPPSWICAACWGDDWTHRWPCEKALREGGVELAKSLGLGWSW